MSQRRPIDPASADVAPPRPRGPISPRRASGARRASRRYLPPQHGAWAMLAAPFAVGVLESHPSWVHVPLLVAWLGGYLLSYFALLALKTRRPARVRRQLVLYAGITTPAVVVVLLARPELLVFAPAFAVLAGINAWFAWRRNERSMLNDVAAVAEACLMAPVAAMAGGAPPGTGWLAAGVLFGYFVGTALYVKTMIRERGSVRWRRASVAFHAVAAAAAWALAWPLGLLFAWFLVRAAVLPRYRIKPAAVGAVEIGNTVALVILVVALT